MELLLDCSSLTVGGGMQVGLATIQSAADDASVSVHLVCSAVLGEQLPEQTIERLTSIFVVESRSGLAKILQTKSIIDQERKVEPDIVFTVFGPSYWKPKAISVQGFALGKMLYDDSRSNYPSAWVRKKEQMLDGVKKFFFTKNADYFVVETPVVQSRLAQTLRVPLQKIFVIGNCYSPLFMSRINSSKTVPLTDGIFRVFIPASFYHHKNLEVVPVVAAELKRLGAENFQFLFTIPLESGGWKNIEASAMVNGVPKMIKSVGAVHNKDIADYYLACDATLCTSLVESSTAVFPETFLSRKPLVVSDRDFARSLCGNAALYVDPLSARDIARKLVLLSTEPEIRQNLIDEGLKVLHSTYPTPVEKWAAQLSMLRSLVKH